MQDQAQQTPNQIFYKTNIHKKIKHHILFGSPVYILEPALQQGQPFHKWWSREMKGIYLGPLPQHAHNVALVLNRTTGLLLP